MVDVEKQRLLLPPPAYSPPLNSVKAAIISKSCYPFIIQAIIRIVRVLVLLPCVIYLYHHFDGNIEIAGNSYISYKLLAILLLQTLHLVELFLSYEDRFLWCALQVSSSVLIILMPILGLLNSVPLDVWISSLGSYVLLIIDYMLYLLTVSDLQVNYYTAEAISAVLACLWCTFDLLNYSWTWKICLFLTMTVWSGSQLLMGLGVKALITYYKQSLNK